jgi:chromosome segregation ATPase
MDGSLNDISHIIRIKEKELHEIHDQRCGQLEQLVSERDSLLIESSKRFEQLRDDFQYNLSLLEARDQEIERLEGHIQKINSELGINDAEKRSLKGRVDILEIKETERFKKHEDNKLANQVCPLF